MNNGKTWYSVELSKPSAEILKGYLRRANIYFEPSEAGPVVHFECHMTPEECMAVNNYLDKYFKGVVDGEQPTA